jgi:antitoxin component YwqK of YwqJK toxin-antitoxin module
MNYIKQRKEYFDNGNISSIYYYDNDTELFTGYVEQFYYNGNIKYEYNMLNGERNGLYKYYNHHGNLSEVKYYTQRKLAYHYWFNGDWAKIHKIYL